MEQASSILPEKATPKCHKIQRTCLDISKKIVAFDVLKNLQHTKRSAREISSIIEVPNSTMRSWKAEKNSPEFCPELNEFFSTPCGTEFIQQIVMAAVLVIEYGPTGIRGLQEFLHLSGLDQFVASSNGALHAYSKRVEQHIVAFGDNEEKRLAEKMRSRKITLGLDEMFRGRRPCLVAIEVVSNFILLEKFTEDRKAETWKKEINTRLEGLKIDVGQVVSDLCGALTCYTKDIGAQHSPDLFHGQYELSKATAAPLSSQERSLEKALAKVDTEVKKAMKKHGEGSPEVRVAVGKRSLRAFGLEESTKRKDSVKKAKKALGEIYHPIDMQTGQIQTADAVKKKVNEQLRIIEESAKGAGLSQSSMNRIAKAGRAFDAMIVFLTTFLIMFGLYVDRSQLNEEQKKFFLETIFPLTYLRMILKRQSKEGRDKLKLLIESLETKVREGPWSNEMKENWMKMAQDRAELFQRSSSCVEGRNGMLSLLHHRCHRLSTSRLKALTVVHNYHIRRIDGSTAAERFFEQKHNNLFLSLVKNVRIPGRPRRKRVKLAEKELVA